MTNHDFSPIRVLASCSGGHCPTIFSVDDGESLLIQGYAISPQTAGVEVPAGEQLVRIPAELVRRAMRAADNV
jgi:hypothetical protein